MTYYGLIAYRSQYPTGFNGVNYYTHKKVPLILFLSKRYVIIPVFLFCLFSAIRYQVGVDCESYKSIYYDLVNFGESYRAPNIEIGFKTLVKITSVFFKSHYLLFFLLAFMQIICYYIVWV